jgi:hypothetical protein
LHFTALELGPQQGFQRAVLWLWLVERSRMQRRGQQYQYIWVHAVVQNIGDFSCEKRSSGGEALLEFEVQVVVIAAAGIELRAASRTGISAPHVLTDGQFGVANATKYRLLVPLTYGPNFNGVIGKLSMAILARIVNAATFHLDGNNVSGSVPVFATSLRIKMDTTHFWKIYRHAVKKNLQPIVNSSS